MGSLSSPCPAPGSTKLRDEPGARDANTGPGPPLGATPDTQMLCNTSNRTERHEDPPAADHGHVEQDLLRRTGGTNLCAQLEPEQRSASGQT